MVICNTADPSYQFSRSMVKDCHVCILGNVDKVLSTCHLRQCLETTATSDQEIVLHPLIGGEGASYALEIGILGKFQMFVIPY